MAEASPDIYALSRKDLRETLKWYSATLSGIAAALAGGISFGIIPDLKGIFLLVGSILAAMLLGLVLYALSQVYSLLAVTPFGADRLKHEPLATNLLPYLSELLPGDVRDMDALEQMLADEEKQKHKNLDEIQRLETLAAKVTSFGSFLDLERRMRETNRLLLVLFCVGCVLLTALTWVHGRAKVAKPDDAAVEVRFQPGASWADYAARLSAACLVGDNVAYPAAGKADTPMKGWWMITLDGPVCKGVTLAVPDAVVTSP